MDGVRKVHYVKIVRIRSFSGPCFPAMRLNTERYSNSSFVKKYSLTLLLNKSLQEQGYCVINRGNPSSVRK